MLASLLDTRKRVEIRYFLPRDSSGSESASIGQDPTVDPRQNGIRLGMRLSAEAKQVLRKLRRGAERIR